MSTRMKNDYVCVAQVEGPDGARRVIGCVGRFAQTLRALVRAGPDGITALDLSSWALRLSHYVFRLRRDHQLNILTVRETHGGPYPGRHGRYVLLDRVHIFELPRSAS
jgi:hypothetical protein